MMVPPHYFEPIRERAARRWDQLEQDPELAGPRHQLFKQVQSPRHILSELLQNADDAGATKASARIEDGCFIFSHDGEDFTGDHFASLCRFGYSNKRALHTIGFRGIGFKSTFSLGDTVELRTPTLAVAFNRQRFTEPKWLNCPPPSDGRTEVRVVISDEHRKREVEKNLHDWLKSPVSLLFFKHIRRIQIGDSEVHWGSPGPGPVPETDWMALYDNADEAFLVARSGAEPFPQDALSKIKQERLLSIEQDTDFPPCKVEIVLGTKGRLYVVLPTGVETALPFACNAPFIQDPGRLKIKDPEISPTNRWLLRRVGTLAASVMLQWLKQADASLADRSRAYNLLPHAGRDDSSLEGTCAAIVKEAFDVVIQDQAYLLTNNGELKLVHESVIIPEEMFDVWPPEQAAILLDNASRPSLSRHVSNTNRKKLVHRGAIEEIGKGDVLNILQTKHLPKSESWRQLLKLWSYVAPELTGYRSEVNKKNVRIVPVQGKNVLYATDQVVRLGERKLLQSDADWQLLDTYLLVLNQNWLRFLAEQRRDAEQRKDKESKSDVDAAYAILKVLNLEESSDVSKVIEQVAVGFFAQDSIPVHRCVQLAQIAAKLEASIGKAFRFVTQDRRLHRVEDAIIFDRDSALEQLLPADWCSTHLLHVDYSRTFGSCTTEEWQRWASSGRAGLHVFVPLVLQRSNFSGEMQIATVLRERGFKGNLSCPYRTNRFRIEDWDFEEGLWQHWHALSKDDSKLWGRIAERIFAQPESFWSKAKSARALQISTTGSTQTIIDDPLVPTWVLKLRELPCLPDTRGFYRKPADLLRRTPETESFIDVEPFIHGRLDTETTQSLLKLLGVRDTPTGPDRVLDCLRALAKAGKPPLHEVEKWYRRLDQMAETCSTADFLKIKQAFREEKITLTEDGAWIGASGVFLSSDEEDVPGAAVVRASVSDLALWRKIGIAERPTADLAIRWLNELPSQQALSQEDLRRIRSLLTRHPARVWEECGHWLNLAAQWAPVETLSYALTMQSLVPWGHLHEWVKQKTADLQRLPAEITDAWPFSELISLAGCIKDRFHRNPLSPGRPERKAWLSQLGLELRRIELDDEADTTRIRALASELTDTVWHTTAGIEIIPYIAGTPAGTPRRAEVVWLDKTLYAEDRPPAKLARAVSQELGRAFRRQDIADAIKLCFDRSPQFVTEYVEENFKLISHEAVEPVPVGELLSTNGIPKADGDEDISRPTSDPSLIERGSSKPEEESASKAIIVPDKDAVKEDPIEDLRESNKVKLVQSNNRHPPNPARPSIIERFARSQDFRKDGEDRFFHANGSWFVKVTGNRFPWEKRSASGDLIRYYWPKDHCLEREPLQIEADIWGFIEKHPDKYALVLLNLHDEPVEVSGARLLGMRAKGELTLYPATYRLVFSHDNE